MRRGLRSVRVFEGTHECGVQSQEGRRFCEVAEFAEWSRSKLALFQLFSKLAVFYIERSRFIGAAGGATKALCFERGRSVGSGSLKCVRIS